uniref:EF-hand domain-containing protein n=1 Tax=Caenorhabditis tropicalis TaxID=1561998 RepID=A0A1I7TM06_9PELO
MPSPSLIEEVQDVFHFHDTVGDGKIAANQLPAALRAMMLNPTEAVLEELTKKRNGGSRITIEEFIPIYKNVESKCGRNTTVKEFQTLLSHFDRDGNGQIQLVELKNMLQSGGEKLTNQEIDNLLFGVEVVDGKINISHFLNNHLQMGLQDTEK